MLLASASTVAQQPSGGIRGVVIDKDFEVPLSRAQVVIVETGQSATTGDQGNFLLGGVLPGRYTLVFSKPGYARAVRSAVDVVAGRLSEVEVRLSGEFTEMEEYIVQDVLALGVGSELALLEIRVESPALVDSIGAEMMSQAGASDAASALRLVAGATLQDGKSAVIRGLPDRYVSSQMNGVRLPSADEDKRAVELDQFPAAVIESIRVSKTFTPDQQGDASGGAVDVRLKGIPDEAFVQFRSRYSRNSQVSGRSDFLTYEVGGVGLLGIDDGDRDIQLDNLGGNWDGAVGVSRDDAPVDHKWSFAAGGKRQVGDGVKIGGYASLFYERDSSFHDNGIDDSYWVTTPGGPMVPQTNQGTPSDGDFKTALFDVTQGTQVVQWGGLAAFGVETENHSVTLSCLYTRTAEDTATLAEDTRGKEYFFPGYDPDDPMGSGHQPGETSSAPYLRLETLDYTERTTGTFQLHGEHKLPWSGFAVGEAFEFGAPELDWRASSSIADLYQPDKRQFGSLWMAPSFNPGFPPIVPPFTSPPTYFPYKPGANFNLGNLQRIWKGIEEESTQFAVDLTLPFKQWEGERGYVKAGWFDDRVRREFDQDTFSNFGDAGASFEGGWDEFWSAQFPFEDHPVTASDADVDYRGRQDITALYSMVDLPLTPYLDLIGGVRHESTRIGIVNDPEADALWVPPGATAPVTLNPGDADVTFEQEDLLPAAGLVFSPLEQVSVRASYSHTVARQTFKELTPIIQQEFLGGPVFLGNPELQMSEIRNHDVRLDCTPYAGGLVSTSWFRKDIRDPIEYVQRVASFTYTTPINYPEGQLEGWEFEMRQDLGLFARALEGFSVGANATFIDSEVTLPPDEAAAFDLPNIDAPLSSRDMSFAPEHIYNAYVTYDIAPTGTQVAIFYTVQGDTLVAGAGQSNGNFVPSVYAREFDTLNLSISQKLGRHFKLHLQAKNLTNPEIEEVYRSPYIGDDVRKTSFTRGIEYSIGISANFSF